MAELQELLDLILIKHKSFVFTVYDLVIFVGILVFAKLLILFLKIFFDKVVFRNKNIERGRQYAFLRIVKYFIYVIAIIAAIESLGLDISILLASSAALFVGIGLGLQQTFNDFISGIILLFEGSIEVGDVVEVDDLVGKVIAIGLRTSKIESREGIYIIVPNHKFVSDNVINWSHVDMSTRFKIHVGVAYGSDTAKVKELLIECAKEHSKVVEHKEPMVFFSDFGNSSLDFTLFFWTDDTFFAERTKSEIRFAIDQKFRENSITIPFPQRDLHIKSNEAGIG